MSIPKHFSLSLVAVVALLAPLFAHGVYFGGSVVTKPLPCNGLSGYFHARIVLPGFFDSEVMWGPGSKFYLNGPYTVLGQNGIGSLGTLNPCDVKGGAAPKALMIDMAPGAGSSLGAGNATEAAAPPAAPTQCTKGILDPSTVGGKAAAESAMRKQLASCNISVNKGACPLGVGFGSVSGGCTDVGVLQCDTVSDLCGLADKCGAFTVTGGSEAGHTYHSGGNAVDVSSTNPTFNSCIEKFSKVDCPSRYRGGSCYKDASGTLYWREPGGTAPHWHICTNGAVC